MKGEDYFAELYVAGVFAKHGWNVYFPHRDQGFDFIISKFIDDRVIIRPVQVKGKYPERSKTDKRPYGYVGRLSQTHPDMVLAIPFFLPATDLSSEKYIPRHTAYMPLNQIKRHKRGKRCEPAIFKNGEPLPKEKFLKFFDEEGIKLLES